MSDAVFATAIAQFRLLEQAAQKLERSVSMLEQFVLELTWRGRLKLWWRDCDYVDPNWR